MHIISRKALRELWDRHPDSQSPLSRWYTIVRKTDFKESALLQETREHWQAIGPLLTIRSERDYDAAIGHLRSLLEEIGDDEQHPQYGLLDTLGTLIHAYEEEHVPIPEASGPEVLEYLMEEHGLKPEDLAESRPCAPSWRARGSCALAKSGH